MNYQMEIIKQIDKLKAYSDFKDLINQFDEVLSKPQITGEEYNQKLTELNSKYPMEMSLISARDTIAKKSGRSRSANSYKEALIDILISITAIKYCEKIGKSYSMQEINSYDFILEVFKN